MYKGIFACCLIFCLNSLFAQSTIDVLHYKFEINLSDQSDTLNGKAEIRFVITQWNKSVSFDLTNLNSNGKGMIVTKADFDSPTLQTSFQQQNDKLTITPLFSYKQGDTLDAVITYKGIPSDGLIIGKNKYGNRTFFGDNWPDRAHNWIPCKDEPGDKASFEFIVTAPAKYQVISNGKKSEEKFINANTKLTHWVEDVPLSTKVMVIGVANFAVKQYADSPPGIPVSAWIYPQDSATGFRNYSVAPEILKFMVNYIAPYPYNKLANVQSVTIFGGMENASAIFYHEETASSNASQERLLAHEIAHQWFGDMASEKKFADLWLSEGFATYLAHLYIENKYGVDSMNQEMKKDRQVVIFYPNTSSHSIVDTTSNLMSLLNPNSYQRGSWVLHMLRRQLGDSVFHKIIRSYYEKFKGKNADTRDFESVAEEVSGKNLKTFFDQWLYSNSIPTLSVNWQYSESKKEVSLTVEQTQPELFQFPLDIKIFTNSKNSTTHTLSINREKQTFVFPTPSRPLRIKTDPNTSLLFKWDVSNIK